MSDPVAIPATTVVVDGDATINAPVARTIQLQNPVINIHIGSDPQSVELLRLLADGLVRPPASPAPPADG